MNIAKSNKKVVLFTGASFGMGKYFSKVLLAEGMTVYTAARRVERMADLQQLGAIPSAYGTRYRHECSLSRAASASVTAT